MLQNYLADLENRIDEQQEANLHREWAAFADGAGQTAPFRPSRRRPAPPAVRWPDININDAIAQEDLMILSQFKRCSDLLAEGSGSLMSVRANYGVGIIPSLLGAEPFIMPYAMNCLPNVRALPDLPDSIRRITAGQDFRLDRGYGPQVFSVAERFLDIKRRYPKIDRYVLIDHPDGQGAIDIAELLWGSDLFYALYDEPELVQTLLDHITGLYQAFMDRWFTLFPNRDGYHAYFGRLHRGAITLREDSAMNMSPELYRIFIQPYDATLLRHFNGGAVHFCGRGDHFIADLAKTAGLQAVDLSQPHLNDMAIILSQTIDQGINLLCAEGPYLEAVGRQQRAWHRLSAG